MVLYLIAWLIFGVFCALMLILRRLDAILERIPPQGQLPSQGQLYGAGECVERNPRHTPRNVYSRHREIVDAMRHGGIDEHY